METAVGCGCFPRTQTRIQKAHSSFDQRMFDWSDEKDAELRQERGIGFEDVLFHLQSGDLLLTAPHPNREQYPNQKIMYIRVDDYVYMVPFVSAGRVKFLKTIIPRRKATKELLGKGDKDEV